MTTLAGKSVMAQALVTAATTILLAAVTEKVLPAATGVVAASSLVGSFAAYIQNQKKDPKKSIVSSIQEHQATGGQSFVWDRNKRANQRLARI